MSKASGSTRTVNSKNAHNSNNVGKKNGRGRGEISKVVLGNYDNISTRSEVMELRQKITNEYKSKLALLDSKIDIGIKDRNQNLSNMEKGLISRSEYDQRATRNDNVVNNLNAQRKDLIEKYNSAQEKLYVLYSKLK